MNPDKPETIGDVVSQFITLDGASRDVGEARASALVKLAIPNHRAGDWFEDGHQDYFKTPDSSTRENYQNPHVKCEDWARNKRLDACAQGNDATEIGGADIVNDGP